MTTMKSRVAVVVPLMVLGVFNVEAFSPISPGSSRTDVGGNTVSFIRTVEHNSRVVALFANNKNNDEEQPKKGFFANFFEELDAFVDDATSRRLGAGSAFYGKRKSNFYGEDDSGKKKNRNEVTNTEDYLGPSSAGYFKWIQDEDGQMKPVTRMKGKVVEKRGMWDKQDDE